METIVRYVTSASAVAAAFEQVRKLRLMMPERRGRSFAMVEFESKTRSARLPPECHPVSRPDTGPAK